MARTSKELWLGFDLGGTKMQATVFDRALSPIATQRRKTKAQEGLRATLGRIQTTIEEALAQVGASKKSLTGIGIGVPGMLDLGKGTIVSAPNLGWKNVALSKYLRDRFGCPAILINDVDAGVYGEYALGAAQGARCVLGIFPGTGIGGGMVYEGKLISGAKRSCMEIGHIPVVADGPLCGCGRRGCLEAVAGRLAIAGACAQAALRGQAPFLMKMAGADLANIRSAAIADAIRSGDTTVEEIVRQAAQWIGRAAASCVNLFAPDTIVLGGGLVEAMPEIYRAEVTAIVRASVLPTFAKTFRVVTAKLGDDASASGAAAWARMTLKKNR